MIESAAYTAKSIQMDSSIKPSNKALPGHFIHNYFLPFKTASLEVSAHRFSYSLLSLMNPFRLYTLWIVLFFRHICRCRSGITLYLYLSAYSSNPCLARMLSGRSGFTTFWGRRPILSFLLTSREAS